MTQAAEGRKEEEDWREGENGAQRAARVGDSCMAGHRDTARGSGILPLNISMVNLTMG